MIYRINKNYLTVAIYTIHSVVWNYFYKLTSYFQLIPTTTTWLISTPNIILSTFGIELYGPLILTLKTPVLILIVNGRDIKPAIVREIISNGRFLITKQT